MAKLYPEQQTTGFSGKNQRGNLKENCQLYKGGQKLQLLTFSYFLGGISDTNNQTKAHDVDV